MSAEGQAAAKRAAAPPPLTSEAQQQAQAEGLTLLVASNTTGYFGVRLDQRVKTKPYQAKVRRGGKQVSLGSFATAEEAALCIARSPEGRAAAAKRAAPQVSEEEGKGTVPPMPPGAFVKEEEFPPMPPGVFVKEEVVKREREDVDEGGRSDGGRPKRRKKNA